MKKSTTVLAVVGLAALTAGAWWWQNRAERAPAGASSSSAATGGPATAAPGANATPGAGGPGGGAAARGGGGGAPGGGAGGPAAVEVATVATARLTDTVQAVGSLKSVQAVVLRPEVSGRIVRLGFGDGQRVKRGQLLVQLDDTLQRAQLQQAEAQASIARTKTARNRELQAQGFVSASAVDQSAADLEVAEAQVALARAQLRRMQVVAPFDGVAGLRSVDVGGYVKDGADIVNLEDTSALTVQFALPERTLDRLRTGQPVELTLDALPGRSFRGRVVALDSQVDANGRALQVLARVDNAGAVLRAGMFARLNVVFSVREAAVVVPEEALVPVGERRYVFKVADRGDGQRVAQRLEARIGLRLPGQVEILDGLKPGDVVVTAGHARLLRGDAVPVRVVDLSRPGGAPAAAARAASGASAARAPDAASAGRGTGGAVEAGGSAPASGRATAAAPA